MKNSTMPRTPSAPPARGKPLGFSAPVLIGLAALGVPRVVLHDLHLIEAQGLVMALLALGPVAIWIAAAVVKHVPNPFLTVLAIGTIFGAMLVTSHQLLWGVAFGDQLPAVGGGALSTVIPRLFAVPSGLITGAMMGAIGGLIAWGLQSALGQKRPEKRRD